MLTQRVLKEWTFAEFKKNLAEQFNVPVEKIRLWSMAGRANKTIRPDAPIADTDEDRSEFGESSFTFPNQTDFIPVLLLEMDWIKDKYARNYPELRLYMEIGEEEHKGADGKVSYFPVRDENGPHKSLLIFLKYYEPTNNTITYAGNLTIRSKQLKIQDILPIIQERMKWDPNTPLKLFEEVKPDMIDPLVKIKQTFEMAELGDGDILCFQRDLDEQQ